MAFEWHDRANCIGVKTEVFFPDSANPSKTLWAKDICRGCPVKAECLEGALERRERFGVWGGLSTGERGILLRNRARRARRESHLIVRLSRPLRNRLRSG